MINIGVDVEEYALIEKKSAWLKQVFFQLLCLNLQEGDEEEEEEEEDEDEEEEEEEEEEDVELLQEV